MNLRKGQREIDDGADHRLPVRPQRDAALVKHRALSWPIEQKSVIAAPAGCDGRGEEHVGDRSVVAIGENDRRPRHLGKSRCWQKVSRHGFSLEGDALRSGRWIAKRKPIVERLPLLVESRDQPRIDRRAIERMVGGRIVGARHQVQFSRACPVAGLARRFRRCKRAVPRRHPGRVIGVNVAPAHGLSNGGELAEVRSAIRNVGERPSSEAVQKVVFEQNAHWRFSPGAVTRCDENRSVVSA